MTTVSSHRRAVTVAATLVGIAAFLPAAAGADTFDVAVSGHPVTRPRPADFVGLAIEDGTVTQWAGGGGRADDDPLGGFVRDLTPTGTANLRIGGQSTDRYWWPVRGVKRPIGVFHDLSPTFTAAARTLASETHAKLTIGVNLESNSRVIARVEGDELVKRIGRADLASLQIGNEPELYTFTPWYRLEDGRITPWYAKVGDPVFSRPPTWNPAAFEDEYAATAKVLPRVPLVGPESGPAPWISSFAQRFVAKGSRVTTLTAHAYGLSQCDTNPSSLDYPSVTNLLSEHASRGLLAGEAADVGAAHHAGAAFRIDEMGSVTCTGRAGVSDTFASALWAMDALFSVARSGVDGVNMHSYPNSDNGLFDIAYEPSTQRWRATVHPLFDGVYMFARADPPGSRILHITSPPQTTMRVWATQGVDHRVRVLLVNDDPAAPETVTVRAPAGYGSATGTVERLTAPSVTATGGVRLGGHPFGSTLTGTPPAPVLERARPSGGRFTVTVPAGSAALLTASTAMSAPMLAR